MERTEALRSIHFDQLEYIQQKVKVDYDNERQVPVSFNFAGQVYPVCEVFGRFKMATDHQGNGYLVEVVDQSVFYLYYQPEDILCQGLLGNGFWVLCFRILHDKELMQWFLEDRKMLTNVSLKRVVDFHGHVCPELALGSKFCEFVQNLLAENILEGSGFSVLAENTTSALDAIQVLLGVTIGNQRLMVMDYGKHNYTLYSRHQDRGWTLRLIALSFADEETFHKLEEKIMTDKALFEDVVWFQQLIDARVRRILDTSPEELFAIETTRGKSQQQESTSLYLTCAICGEQVLANHCIESRNKMFCLPCFQKETPGCAHYGMQ